jgi:hypothetical protein
MSHTKMKAACYSRRQSKYFFPNLVATATERALATAPVRQGVVHLIEERVFTQIVAEEEAVSSS